MMGKEMTGQQLREAVEEKIVELIQLPSGKTITQSDYTDAILSKVDSYVASQKQEEAFMVASDIQMEI